MSVRQHRKTTEYGATFALTRISIIPRSFIHCGAKQTTKYVYPKLNAIQRIPHSFIHASYNVFLVLSSMRHTTYSSFFHPHAIQRIPCSFIHCWAKRKSILDIGSRIDWHISVGELTFNISKSTSYVGKLVVAKTTEKLINDLQTHQPHKVRDKQSQQKDPWLHQQHNHEKTQLQRIGKPHCRNQQVQIYRHPRILSIHQPRPPKQSTRLRLHLWQHYHQRKKNYNPR